MFIIFLLVVIGLLTYSHLQLLMTLDREGQNMIQQSNGGTFWTEKAVSKSIQSPPLAHRAGTSPIMILNDKVVKDDNDIE